MTILRVVKPDSSELLVLETLPEFLSELENPRTQAAYEAAVQQFCRWHIERFGISLTWMAWSKQETRQWISSLQQAQQKDKSKPASPATIRQRLTALRSYARWGIEHKYLRDSPTTIKGVRQQKKPTEALTGTQKAALLRAVAQHRNPLHRVIVLLLLHTGVRAGELAGMRLQDITLGEQRAPLTATKLPKLETIRTGVVSIFGKGSKYREVPLNSEARRAILEWMPLRPIVQSDMLLISPKFKQPIGVDTIEYACNQFRSITPRMHPHLLRATFATDLIANGEPIERVALLMGHENLDTTAQYYLVARTYHDAVEKLVDK